MCFNKLWQKQMTVNDEEKKTNHVGRGWRWVIILILKTPQDWRIKISNK